MDDMDKYEQLHELASRDWFKSSSVSLAKLDQIKATVYNINPHKSTQSLRPGSASRSRSHRGQSYTELQAEPPLSAVNLQQSSWGNNPSVPNLIKQQGERQRRVASSKGPRRPWSGRKVPPSPTLQKLEKQEEQLDDKYKAFIAVKGSKYDPQSRPPSGRPSTSEVSGNVGDGISKRTADSALEDFLKAQADGDMHDLAKLSAAYAHEDTVTPPPPAPRTSPDIHQMLYGDTTDDINHMLYGESSGDISDEEEKAEIIRLAQVKEITVKQPSAPQLLRRPTPEPMRLSMTIPVMDSVSDEEGEVLNSERYNKSPSLDMEVQSVTSEVSGHLDGYGTSNTRDDTWNGGIRSVTLSSKHHTTHLTPTNGEDVTVSSGDAKERDARERNELNGDKEGLHGRRSVRIDESHNVTNEISPRCVTSNEPLMPHPPPARRRPHSATASLRLHHDVQPGRGHTKSSDSIGKDRVPQRPKSARARSLKIATVAIDYGADGEVKQNGHTDSEDLARKESKVKKRPEIETMMSRISLSDEDDEIEDGSKTSEHNVQYSTTSAKTNFYKAATASSQATLTTKTIAFTDAGVLENKTVSKIGQVPEKPFVGRIGVISSSKQLRTKGHDSGSESESRGTLRTHSAITRPMKNIATLTNSKPPERPMSRMGSRPEDQGNLSDERLQDSHTAPRKLSRPVSAPVKRRGKGLTSGRKSPSKTSRRPKSAATPMKQNYLEQPHIALQPSSQSMKGITPPKKSASERERHRAAVQALREGTLNKEKKYTGQIAFEETKHVIEYTPRYQESSESSSEEEIEIPVSEQDKQMQEIHERLLAKGVNVSAKTLARGLLPPAQREYDECSGQLPQKSSHTLLNHPEAWLGQVFKKYKMAERALQRANVRMIEQTEMEAKVAARQALESGKKKKRKKGKKRKVKKKTSKNSAGTA